MTKSRPNKKSKSVRRGQARGRVMRSDFVRRMLWTQCRHRRSGRKKPFREIGICAIAREEDPRARFEFGRGDCQKAQCPYFGRDDVP